MLINWFTVGAQIFNFLLLMVLLKIFLYDRIVQAMDAREQRVASRLEDAEHKLNQAEERRQEFERRSRELEESRQQTLDDAKQEAEKRRKELVAQARTEVAELKEGWRKALQRDQEAFLTELRRQAAGHIYALTRRALDDLAGQDPHRAVVDGFLRRLDELAPEERQALAESASREGRVEVRCAREPSAEEKRVLTRSLHERLGKDLDVDYVEDPELRLGLSLQTRGRKLAWNLDDYLDELEARATELLEEEARRRESDDAGQDGQEPQESPRESSGEPGGDAGEEAVHG